MHEPQRALVVPGVGIMRPQAPTREHHEFPKMMVHPGFQPGVPDQEIQVGKGSVAYVGGQAIRFPPVLVHDEAQEAGHAAQGYISMGKTDPAAFARMVATATPLGPQADFQEYPKWVKGKLVNSAEEEADILDQAGMLPSPPAGTSEVASSVPALSAEVDTLKDKYDPRDLTIQQQADRITYLETELASIKALLAKPRSRRAEPADPQPAAPSIAGVVADLSANRRTRSEAIKAGIARRKKEKEDAARAAAQGETAA